jgi:hypothetical protein
MIGPPFFLVVVREPLNDFAHLGCLYACPPLPNYPEGGKLPTNMSANSVNEGCQSSPSKVLKSGANAMQASGHRELAKPMARKITRQKTVPSFRWSLREIWHGMAIPKFSILCWNCPKAHRRNAILEIRRWLSPFSNLNARTSFAMHTRRMPHGRKSGHISPRRQLRNDSSLCVAPSYL